MNNGGCSCGCGVKCEHYFERWNCPGDIGCGCSLPTLNPCSRSFDRVRGASRYACSGDLEAAMPPFFGDTTRYATCTLQPPRVESLIAATCLLLPAILLIVAGVFALSAPIDAATHTVSESNTPRLSFSSITNCLPQMRMSFFPWRSRMASSRR